MDLFHILTHAKQYWLIFTLQIVGYTLAELFLYYMGWDAAWLTHTSLFAIVSFWCVILREYKSSCEQCRGAQRPPFMR